MGKKRESKSPITGITSLYPHYHCGYHGKRYSKTEAGKCLKATKRYIENCVKPVLESKS